MGCVLSPLGAQLRIGWIRAEAYRAPMPAPHERLEAWEASHALTLAVYRATDGFPRQERVGLTSQLRRAAVAIPANLAEGAAKRGRREFRRFLDIALGSIGELTYLLRLARDLDYLTPEAWSDLELLRDRAGKLTWGLYKAVRG
jgi:four helix bundle protein